MLENGADQRAEVLPSLNEVLEGIAGMPALAVELAAAYGGQRFLDFLDVLDDIRNRNWGKITEEEGEEEEDEWLDAAGPNA